VGVWGCDNSATVFKGVGPPRGDGVGPPCCLFATATINLGYYKIYLDTQYVGYARTAYI